jgi:cation-transporting ATPase F
MALSHDPDEAGRSHHGVPLHELVLLLETDPENGLDEATASERLRRFGPNELAQGSGSGVVVRLLRQIHSPLIYVLLVSGVVTFFLGEYVDSAVIFGVVVVNTLVGFVQESKAETALDALRSMVYTEARVVRDGSPRLLPSRDLVPGDLVLVEAGDKVPADLRLVREWELQADESALTGESLPVEKDEVVLAVGTPVADRRNMLYSGTFVTAGTGAGVVVATGGETELGEIHRLVGSAEELATPLTRKLAVFSAWLTVVIVGLAAATFAVGVARGEPTAQMFTAAVALAVGAIPEGLPAAVTVTLAIGVSRMARRRAVIRRLPAVETLGGATVICTDKTGTLTENRMTVRALWAGGATVDVVEGLDVSGNEALRWCLLAGAGANDSRLDEGGEGVGDPTETAMLVVARAAAVEMDWPREAAVPFSSERQYMVTQHLDPATGDRIVMVKGAVERVLDLCTGQLRADGGVEPLDPEAVRAAVEELAGRGMRVLATAVGRGPGVTMQSRALTLAGLQAMIDPPRRTAAEAVALCRQAGLQVKMITGDHAGTAAAIARQVRIVDEAGGRVLTGVELEELDDERLPEAAERTAVFARVDPEQKLRLVRALQARHHVVAMTGDGVNDAPALKQADIGVAMGLGGTEVAKEAGDMVLTDDDFATIEAAVEEGRGVFDNLTKFIVWTLPTNTGEALVILLAVMLGSALPILPTQILWINMTTAVLLGLTLAWEPKEPGIMARPPRDPRRSLLTGPVLFRTLLVSALLVAGSWFVFEQERALGASLEASRTAAMNVFVVVMAFYLFSCRSLTEPVRKIGILSNPWLLGGVALQAIGQLAITYLGVMNELFGTAPINGETWLRIVAVAVLTAAVVAVDKRWLSGRYAT